MGNKLTFGELIHSLSDYNNYSEMHLNYEQEDNAFWDEYLKYLDEDSDGEFYLEDREEEKLVNFLISFRDKWYRDKLVDLFERYDANTESDSEELVKLALRYLGLSYKKLNNRRNIKVKELQKADDVSDCIVEATFELFANYITNIYYRIFEAFIVDFDLEDFESAGEDIKDFESISDSIYDKWLSDYKLEEDLSEEWTAFYIYVFMANYIMGCLSRNTDKKCPLDGDVLKKLSQRVMVLYRYVWYGDKDFGADIDRLLR